MKLSKQILLLITPILFLVFASGCSKSLIRGDDMTQTQPEEEKVSVADTSPAQKETTGSSQNFDAVEQGSPNNGNTTSLSANGEAGSVSESGAELPSSSKAGEGEGDASFGFGPNASAQNFGSAKQGMPGNGSSGSFNAEPFKGNNGGVGSAPSPGSEFFTEKNVGEFDTDSRLYEKPGSRNFGSTKQGMPGNGSSGSFSAEPFNGEGGLDSSSALYEKPGPRNFGSTKQGMPGDGSSGSFSAEPFSGETGSFSEEPSSAEPFSGENAVVAQLPKEEEVRRQLPYRPSDHLQDIHFAFDKFDLTDKSRAILRQNADYLNAHPNSRIEIQGHCDERGSNNYNITLGERRAQSAQSYLVSLGVDESRIHTISYGEERPFCFESNEKCWYQNRRGHFLVAE